MDLGRRSPAANRWRLHDAGAQLGKVVRDAQTHGPQWVTVHGPDAAVIVSAAEFDWMGQPVSGRDIVRALADSPLRDIPFEGCR
jgi:prevent-host-death family protein